MIVVELSSAEEIAMMENKFETKFDISEGINSEIERLNEILMGLRANKFFVKDSTGADVTSTYDHAIAGCALELSRVKTALDLLKVA